MPQPLSTSSVQATTEVALAQEVLVAPGVHAPAGQLQAFVPAAQVCRVEGHAVSV